jgi:hypothetical protein
LVCIDARFVTTEFTPDAFPTPTCQAGVDLEVQQRLTAPVSATCQAEADRFRRDAL